MFGAGKKNIQSKETCCPYTILFYFFYDRKKVKIFFFGSNLFVEESEQSAPVHQKQIHSEHFSTSLSLCALTAQVTGAVFKKKKRINSKGRGYILQVSSFLFPPQKRYRMSRRESSSLYYRWIFPRSPRLQRMNNSLKGVTWR